MSEKEDKKLAKFAARMERIKTGSIIFEKNKIAVDKCIVDMAEMLMNPHYFPDVIISAQINSMYEKLSFLKFVLDEIVTTAGAGIYKETRQLKKEHDAYLKRLAKKKE